MQSPLALLNERISEEEDDGEVWRDWDNGDEGGWEQLRAYDEEDPTAPKDEDEDDDGYPLHEDYTEESAP